MEGEGRSETAPDEGEEGPLELLDVYGYVFYVNVGKDMETVMDSIRKMADCTKRRIIDL